MLRDSFISDMEDTLPVITCYDSTLELKTIVLPQLYSKYTKYYKIVTAYIMIGL